MNNLIISQVNVRLKDEKGMKALCTIVLNDMFAIHGVRVIEDKYGKIHIAMPSRKMPNGRHTDICNPITKEARNLIEEAVLNEYEKARTLSDEILKLIL